MQHMFFVCQFKATRGVLKENNFVYSFHRGEMRRYITDNVGRNFPLFERVMCGECLLSDDTVILWAS